MSVSPRKEMGPQGEREKISDRVTGSWAKKGVVQNVLTTALPPLPSIITNPL